MSASLFLQVTNSLTARSAPRMIRDGLKSKKRDTMQNPSHSESFKVNIC